MSTRSALALIGAAVTTAVVARSSHLGKSCCPTPGKGIGTRLSGIAMGTARRREGLGGGRGALGTRVCAGLLVYCGSAASRGK